MQATATQRYNFAVQHMMSAARFSRLCYQVEKANAGQPFGPFFEEISSYVSASIFTTVAALEANINETFADVQDDIVVITNFDKHTLHATWSSIERLEILEKYQRFLELEGKAKLARGARDYQRAQILIRVRNALIHYKPEWHAEQKEHQKIGRDLRGKFILSPFPDENAPIFPLRCMTHGFTEWAIQSTLNFAELFAKTAGIHNRFTKHIDRMNTKP